MALHLYWNNEQERIPVTDEMIDRLRSLLALAGKQEGVEDGEVALTLTDDEGIHRLNKEYRGIDRPTDVLSFPQHEPGEDEPDINYDDLEEVEDLDGAEEGADSEESFEDEEPLGDIVISLERAQAQSEEYGHSLEREIGFLFVHGFLHLIGYDHETEEDEREMIAKQEAVLQEAGLTR
ncbi:rRNA maturation RNase YbeY [Paenibacillus sp. CC-CFT747]|nr:rRNA maturation RNase YbeY [Paenibacillus sp. CC-CFT747]